MTPTVGASREGGICHKKLPVLRLACSLALFMAISFVLCVVAGLVLPGFRSMMPIGNLVGFSWDHPLSAAPWVLWAAGVGAYVGVLFGLLYNLCGALIPSRK